jgi:catechol 2,3-dioxygenase
LPPKRLISVGKVGLRARDAAALSDYYQKVVGLRELSRDGATITLGAGERPLLVLEQRQNVPATRTIRVAPASSTPPSCCPRAPISAAGSTMPSRSRSPSKAPRTIWSRRRCTSPIPEGNGIEIYADRAPSTWRTEDGNVKMATLRMNIPDVRASVPAGDAGWQGAPDGSIVGHVHLRVGDPTVAEDWWHKELGFDTMAKYGADAVFLSTGGYHHHIGANTWQSRGAGPATRIAPG